jgi:hypothetical protein
MSIQWYFQRVVVEGRREGKDGRKESEGLGAELYEVLELLVVG